MSLKNIFGVIMAGGRGERFWPQSRVSHPKQLLRLIGNLTLIEQTVQRLLPLVPIQNILIITNGDYIAPMRSLLPDIPPENIIGEPVGKDTAPCIALASAMVKAKAVQGEGEPVMIALPADHVIKDTASMIKVLHNSISHALDGKLVTIGINPTFPSTGYGYIHCGDKIPGSTNTDFYTSRGFKEKPDIELAKEFIKDSSYKWNSGMFIWSLSSILGAFKKYQPDIYAKIEPLSMALGAPDFNDKLTGIYNSFEKISIDYAVMEKADNVVVAQASFDWDDVGSWTALRNQIRPEKNNNIVRGLCSSIGTSNCIIVGDSKHLIATVDLDDIIIVHTDDATLVCNAKSAQKIKDLVQLLGASPELAKFV